MKGTLNKTEQGWVVRYGDMQFLPLHPKYEKYYFLDEDAEGGKVEFEVVKEFIDNYTNQVQEYAKLVKDTDEKYPELEGTMALCNDKIWDDIYDEYSTEQYPPFGGPFTNALEFIVWLKQNFKAPERIK